MNQPAASSHPQPNTPPKPTPRDQMNSVWQKPHIKRLRVSLDTAASFGSGGDGIFMTSTGP